ncbi:M56 family metallopeptidase [Pedobacter sp. KBS0701]|uniref:M56 family metallopeptidase n=1 Tax=Pedobacter sp. KBS0701 TaxID=2578106 RepID=UPI00110E609F|nr:M56 family metallopeptidase [Pedobacter sp. KBS0701]QDW26064.1 M56 family metallopeptidase [Pedobacter sp. KBS0701]
METLLQQFIKAFGWSILNSLWQSAIIYGILFIVMLSIPKLAAKYKHNLAFGAIMLMFIGFSYNIIHQLTLNINDHAPAISPQNIQVYQYFNNLPPSFSSKAEQYFPIVVIFYAIGIVLQLFVIIKGYGQLSKLKKESLSTIPDSWKTIFEQVTTRLKINKVIRFHLSSIVNVPLVIGYLKPVVLFPLALVSQLDNDQVEAILIHELSHIRRNDFLLNLIKTAIETLLFYNPFVWMAGRFIHIEREHACDDLVLKITGKPLNYAHALLKLELLKDKNSPAYALAATGQTQNLYQRIKRITNMKTNYLNAKQQMAALTLGVACLFSIAWINPTEKKKENKIQPKQEILSVRSANGTISHLICTDTTKKRKIKIITIDANGNKKEYNSLKEMPDSLRKDFYRDELFGGNGIYRINLDSSFKFRLNDSLLNKKLYKEYNSPEAQAKWKKFGEDMAKQYSSPEAQAKWKKFGEDVAKQYSSPEAQAKWKKFGEDIAKQYNSPEAQAKWRKFSEEMQKKMNSPEAQAKWKKFGEDMAAKINTPEFRAQLDNIRMQVLKSGDMVNLSGLTNLQSDSIFKGNRNTLTGPDGTVFFYNDNNNTNSKVKQTEEYKKLKEKFDSEVKELKEKMEKKEKIDGGNKSSQISPAVMLYNNKNFSDPAKILKIENAVVTYKKADFKIADQLALKSFLKTDNPIAIANNNTISISIK